MNHAEYFARQFDEQAEFGDVLDLALEHAAFRIFLFEGCPRVGQALLEAKADTPLVRIDVEHHDFDFLARRNDLAGMDIFLGPAHFRNMDQALNAGLKLHECTVIGDVRYPAGIFGVARIFRAHAFPRISFKLLHAERNTLGLRVEANNLNLDALADLQGVSRVVDAAPRNVGDMQQSIDTTQVNECTVVGDILNHAVQNLPFGQVRH